MGRAEDLYKRIVEGGSAAVAQLIRDRQSEELFLDFKRSADNGSGTRLHDTDRGQLARAISGFGNSEGGVIVWGVDCRQDPGFGDVARMQVPIDEPKRFVSWLEGAASGCTIPPHPDVRNAAIELSASSGFAATYVKKSYLALHQCVKPPQYFIRVGSDFVPAPHGVLMSLFGRPPQPFVFHMWTLSPATAAVGDVVKFQLGFVLGSHGPGMARDLYVNIKTFRPKGRTEIAIQPDSTNWTGHNAYGVLTNLVSKDSFKLSPGSLIQPFVFAVRAIPPFESEFSYEITFGHGASQMRRIETRVSPEKLVAAHQAFATAAWSSDVGRRFVEDFMDLDADNIYGEENTP
jgi:hypothetical protein